MSKAYGDFKTKDYCANFYDDNKYCCSVMFNKCTQRCLNMHITHKIRLI